MFLCLRDNAFLTQREFGILWFCILFKKGQTNNESNVLKLTISLNFARKREMTLRSVFMFLIFLLCALFLVVNWTGITTEVPVNLLYEETQAPLGLVLLFSLGSLVCITLMYAFVQNATLSMELRKAHKELEKARQLAQSSEKSRFTQLNQAWQTDLMHLQEENEERQKALFARITELENQIRENARETVNSVSASVGEVEDRINQVLTQYQQNDVKENPTKIDNINL